MKPGYRLLSLIGLVIRLKIFSSVPRSPIGWGEQKNEAYGSIGFGEIEITLVLNSNIGPAGFHGSGAALISLSRSGASQ